MALAARLSALRKSAGVKICNALAHPAWRTYQRRPGSTSAACAGGIGWRRMKAAAMKAWRRHQPGVKAAWVHLGKMAGMAERRKRRKYLKTWRKAGGWWRPPAGLRLARQRRNAAKSRSLWRKQLKAAAAENVALSAQPAAENAGQLLAIVGEENEIEDTVSRKKIINESVKMSK